MKLAQPLPIVSIGGIKFAPSASALVDTLFAQGGTASGIYSVRKNGVLFKRADGEPFAFLVANPGQSRFFVSAHKHADGKLWFSYGLSDADKASLGLSGFTYSAESDEAERIWQTVKAAYHPVAL